MSVIAAIRFRHAFSDRYFKQPTRDQLETGLCWVFPGIVGRFTVVDALRAFRDAGVASAFEVHDWRNPLMAGVNLMAHARNLADAKAAAERIECYHRDHPELPIDLVGYSGGGGMAILTADALGPSVRLRNVVLVHPAISPGYDLTGVLEHVDGKLVNFHSPLDRYTLGLGTSIFGTIDRKHTAAAGKDGFQVGESVGELDLRDRLVQRAWSSEWGDAGHRGGHHDIGLFGWNRRFVSPYLVRGDDRLGGMRRLDSDQ